MKVYLNSLLSLLCRALKSRKGSSTMEYVIIIACGMALALLLNQVMASAEVQGSLKDKIIQVLTGQNMSVSIDADQVKEDKHDPFEKPKFITDLTALKNKFKKRLSEAWENVKNKELGEVTQSLWNKTTNALDRAWQWAKENKEAVASGAVLVAGIGLLLIPGLEPLGLMLLANWGLSFGFGTLLNGGKVDKTVMLGAAIGGAAGAIGSGAASAFFAGLTKLAPGLVTRFSGPIISSGKQILGRAPAFVQRMVGGLFSKVGAMTATEGAITSGVDDWLRGKELNWKRAILSGLAGATLVGFAFGTYPLVQPLINKATASIEKHAGPVVAKINQLPIPTLEAFEAVGVGKVSSHKTIGDTEFGTWLQRFTSNGNRNLNSVPTVKNGEFNRWFNSLTPDEFDQVWSDPSLRKTIESRLRHPGGLHEWLLVSRAPTFKRWGVTAEQIKELRTTIRDVKFVNPQGAHGRKGSTRAHNELLEIIDSSTDYTMFKRRLQNWANYRLEGGAQSLPRGLRP
ncbi:DUF4244 domain-containing protein [Laceyella tengchongensis]